jgi:sugar phosphate isomerase/epimerase
MRSLSRRDFIDLSLASSLAVPFSGFAQGHHEERAPAADGINAAAGRYIDDIGFQVFTLRDLLVYNARSLFRSLSQVGIKNIEFFNPATLNDYVPIVKEYGMTPLCTHFMPGFISGNWESAIKMGFPPPDNYHFDNIIEDCSKNGIKYMGIAIVLQEERETLEHYRRFADKVNRSAEKCKSAGIQLYYHNHSFEFEPMAGTTPYDELLKILEPGLVRFELDVFWLTVAGADPIQWIRKMGDRLLFVHLKDLKKGTPVGHYTLTVPRESYLELGSGVIDFNGILTEARKRGIRYVFIDQDYTQMNDKIESVRKSCDYIRALGI